MRLFKDLLRLFFPELCIHCSQELMIDENVLCTCCKNELPLIPIHCYENNIISTIFYGQIALDRAVSLLFYQKENITQQLIHHLKYKGRQDIGTFLANYFTHTLVENSFFDSIDYIVPVPLYYKKERKRGYNQLTKFCLGLHEISKVPIAPNVLIKTRSTSSQTFKSRFERAENVTANFLLNDHCFFEDKHILLVDDVITTGATIESCCRELLKTKNVKISILSIALTQDT